jgi:hypothetical protein
MKFFGLKLLIILLFIANIFVRYYQIDSVPKSLNWDELSISIDAKFLAENGLDMHSQPIWSSIFYSWGDYKLPGLIWLANLVARFTHDPVIIARLPNIVFGIFHILLVGALGRLLLELVGKKSLTRQESHLLWLGTMLVMLGSTWSILFSRTGFEAMIAQFFLTASIYLYIKLNKHWFSPIIVAAVGALSVYTYYSSRFVWPVVFVFAGILLLHSRPSSAPKSVKNLIGKLGKPLAMSFATMVCFFSLLIPLINSKDYSASQQFRLSTPSLLNDATIASQKQQLVNQTSGSPVTKAFFSQKVILARKFVSNLLSHLSPNFLFFSGDTNLRHSTTRHGLFLVTFLPIFLAGSYQLAQSSPSLLLFLTSWWLAGLVPASIPYQVPHALRSLGSLTPVSLIIIYGFYYLLKFWVSQKTQFFKFIFASIFILVVGLNAVEFFNHYFKFYPKASAVAWNDGYQTTAKTAFKMRDDADVPILVNLPDQRSFLWFVLEGNYKAAEVQSWNSNQHQFDAFDNIFFESNVEDGLNKINSINKIIVVLPATTFEEVVKDNDYNVLEEHNVFTSYNRLDAVVALLSKNEK